MDEWDVRCHESMVRNPAGYLFGIIQKAMRGEFQPWAGQKPSSSPPTKTPVPQPSIPASPEVAQAHINRLRSILKLP